MKESIPVFILIVLSLFFLSSCGISPINEKERIYWADFDTTWKAVKHVLKKRMYSIRVIKKEKGLIITDYINFARGKNAKKKIDRIAIRPSGFWYRWREGRFSISIQVIRIGKGITKVRIKLYVEAYESRITFRWHLCQSRGNLEEELFREIEEKIRAS